MKIGDRVIVNGEYAGLEFVNESGRIMGFVNGDVCIEFDNYVNGHSYCNILVGVETKPGHSWLVSPKMIKKEELMKERIEALEKELAALKACQKYEPVLGKYMVSITGGVEEERDWVAKLGSKVGNCFDTKEKAKKARDIMVKHDVILKYVIDHAPDYVPEENNMYGVYFDIRDNFWYEVCHTESPDLGTILMPEWVAAKLVDDLNNNRIEGM